MLLKSMQNVKSIGGTFKGLIGECLFKVTDDRLTLTRFFGRNKWLELFGERLSESQRNFIFKNWYSLDVVRIPRPGDQACIYEVKTRNRYKRMEPHWINKFSARTTILYKEATSLGIQVFVTTVWMEDDWNYSIEIKPFSESEYVVDSPKRYDRTGAIVVKKE